MFKNAVASAQVRETLTGRAYTLAYLPEGEYELHFAAYKEDTTSGRVGFASMLKSESSANGSVGNIIRVQAGISVSISTTINGSF
jgi:hypothetical protein